MSVHLGSFNTATSRTRVRFGFTTNDAAGAAVAPSSAFEAADLVIYRANDSAAFSATQRSSSSGVTMTSPFDSITGMHFVDIDLTDNTDAGFYAAGYTYAVVLNPDETVDSQTVNKILAYFEIGPPPVNVTQLLGTAWLTPATAGTPDVNVKLISGDATAADNAEAFFDGTGYAGTGNVIPTVTNLTNLPAITANWLTAAGTAADFGTEIGAAVLSALGTGTWASAIPWNASWDAEVQSEVQDAIEANNLDHLVLSAVDTNFATTVHANSVIGHLADNGAGFDRTTDSLEALRDRGDAAWTTATGFSTHSAADVWSVATRVLTAGTNIALAKGTGVTGFNDLSAAQVNAEVLDVLNTDTFAQPTGVPSATVSLAEKIGRLYQALTSELTVTSTALTFFSHGGSALWKKTLADDGTTYSETDATTP